MNIIDKRKFNKAVLDKESNTYIIYIATLEILLVKIAIFFLLEVWISTLKQNEAFNKILIKSLDFSNIFS